MTKTTGAMPQCNPINNNWTAPRSHTPHLFTPKIHHGVPHHMHALLDSVHTHSHLSSPSCPTPHACAPRFRSHPFTPEFTIVSHTTCMRSSMPLTPLGMRRKSSRPAAFCSEVNTAWSVATSCSTPRARA